MSIIAYYVHLTADQMQYVRSNPELLWQISLNPKLAGAEIFDMDKDYQIISWLLSEKKREEQKGEAAQMAAMMRKDISPRDKEGFKKALTEERARLGVTVDLNALYKMPDDPVVTAIEGRGTEEQRDETITFGMGGARVFPPAEVTPMTENWDSYALLVDGEPASIFVDLGIESDAPLSSHPHMAYIRLFMNQSRSDGLSSKEEFDALITIEKSMEANLCKADVGYVGRNTSGCCRDFYFYVSNADDWQSKVDRVLSKFENYKYETGTREDAGWSTYLIFLLPGKVDRQRIGNRRVCEALEGRGDKLIAPREIDHFSYFQTPEAVDAFLAEVAADGFQVRGKPVSHEGDLRFGAQVWRVDIPS